MIDRRHFLIGLEHAYLIDGEGIEMAERTGAYIIPTMQMTQEDLYGIPPVRAVWRKRGERR